MKSATRKITFFLLTAIASLLLAILLIHFCDTVAAYVFGGYFLLMSFCCLRAAILMQANHSRLSQMAWHDKDTRPRPLFRNR